MVGQQRTFTAAGYRPDGEEIPVDPIWSASGGTIDQQGVYTALVQGEFVITASVKGSEVVGTAAVHVL